jgi:hypothetical protein
MGTERAPHRASGTYRIGSRKRRRHARVLTNLPVDLLTPDGERSVRCTELGVASLVLDAGPALAYGDAIQIVLPGAIRVSGVVRWNGFRGYGVQLGSLCATATHALIDLIRRA